ncbi:MAG: GyrI-like domain-containing protein, partial [Solibacillus sp.]
LEPNQIRYSAVHELIQDDRLCVIIGINTSKQRAPLNKDELVYTIMIRQPDFVTKEIVERAFETVEKKKPHPFLNEVTFDVFQDGSSVQMLHIGPYDDEPQSFELMNEFTKNNNLERVSLQHREIYLSDFRKVEPAKLKTVLRYKVRSIE